MTLSKIKTLAFVLAITTVASAQFNVPQSARKAALAGAPMSDITDLYRYPALVTGYADHIHATWDGGVIGTKSINDMLLIGILANQGLMAPGFATAAATAVNGFVGGSPGAPGFDTQFNIPHLLLGFNLGTLSLGADVFFEYAGYNAHADGAPPQDYSAYIMNPGAKFSAAIESGDLSILAKAGFGMPSVNGETPPSGSDKLSSASGMYIEMGAEAGMPIADADWTFGLDYTRSDHRFKVGNTSDANSVCNSQLTVYIGSEFNFVETAVAALQYAFVRNAQTTTQPDASGNPSAMTGAHHHVLSAGIENAWEKVWAFDSFMLRGGAAYRVDVPVGKTHAGSANSNYKLPGTHTEVTPTLGLGFSKAFFTLDVAINPGSWGGVFTGPNVLLASGTIKF